MQENIWNIFFATDSICARQCCCQCSILFTFKKSLIRKTQKKIFSFQICFHVSFTFLVLLFWTFLVRSSGPPTPSCQKEQENHKIGPQMSRIGTRKVKETQKIVFQSRFLEIRPKNFLTRYARQKTISAYISRKLDQKYTIVCV